MTPEKLLTALNDIDSGAIREAHADPEPARKPRRRLALLIAAVLAVTALTATAFAAEEISGWFREYFVRNSENNLTPGQIEYIEENEQIYKDTQECNGYSLELKSILSDGNNVYLTLGLTAPSDVTHDDLIGLWGSDIDFYDGNKKPCFTWSMQFYDDRDGLENTADLVFEFNPADWNNGNIWTLRIDSLGKLVHNKEYEQELLNTKYAGQENIMFTDEEAALIYQQVTLAEGPWEFEFDLSQVDIQTLELITEPVTAQSCYGFKPDGTNVYEDVQITSFILAPLSATIKADSTTGALDFTSDYNHHVYVIMKDGSQIELCGNWGSIGEQHLTAESPIVLDQVDYVLLPDGVKLMAP